METKPNKKDYRALRLYIDKANAKTPERKAIIQGRIIEHFRIKTLKEKELIDTPQKGDNIKK